MNSKSSRSHALFMVKLYSKEQFANSPSKSMINYQKAKAKEICVSTFTFVDLAGSEKIDEECDIERVTEAKYINKSLSALGNVINALKNRDERKNKITHIPYRDSKLTHIMKSCLKGGDSQTQIIICLSPSCSSL
jgi:hypothetical protein